MRIFKSAALLSLILVALAYAGEAPAQSVTLPATVNVPKPGLVVIAPTALDADDIAWTAVDDGLQLIPSTLLKDGKTAVGMALVPGSYRVRAVAARTVMGKASLSPFAECTIVVGGAPPVPPGPTPPGPNPPGPTPPIPAAGLRVMIIYETADLGKMPSQQQDILYAKSVRDYLIAKCQPTTDGGRRGWYITDKDADFSGESKVWQDGIKKSRTQTPWIIVTNSASSYEGPLPATVSDTLALLKKYGG